MDFKKAIETIRNFVFEIEQAIFDFNYEVLEFSLEHNQKHVLGALLKEIILMDKDIQGVEIIEYSIMRCFKL